MLNILIVVFLTVGELMAAQSVVERDVLAAERAFFAAINAGDVATRTQLLSDDFTGVNRNGQLQTKADDLNAPHPPEMRSHDEAIRVYGDVAVVVGVLDWRNAMQGLRYTAVWRRADSGWQQVAYQSCPITDHAGDAPVPQALPVDAATVAEAQVIREVEQAEDARARAQRAKSASSTNDLYRTLTADDYTATTSGGRLAVKTETAGERTPYEAFQTSDVAIRAFGNVAIVTGIQTYRVNGKTMGPFRFTRVWVRREGRWQVVAHHATTVQSTSSAEKDVLAADEQFTAMATDNDVSGRERLVAREFVNVSFEGEVSTRDQQFQLWRTRRGQQPVNNGDVRVRVHGEVAVVTGPLTHGIASSRR